MGGWRIGARIESSMLITKGGLFLTNIGRETIFLPMVTVIMKSGN